MDSWGREIVARHEAAHAVTAIVLGWSVRYVTLRPHGGPGGATWTTAPCRYHLLDAGAVFLAGLAVESDLLDDRRFMVAGARDDLRDARDAARYIVDLRARRGSLPRVDDSWSEWDLGARMWSQARDLVAEYREAIEWVAAALLSSRRAVPGSWIRRAVETSPRCDAPAEPGEWWAPRYSRLRWSRGLDAPS